MWLFIILTGLLPIEAVDTGEFLLRLNDVFDNCNSSTPRDPNLMKETLSKSNEADRRKTLEVFSAWLGRRNVRVPSVAGFQLTTAGVKAIWDRFGGDPLEFLMTRRLNQYCLENLFGVIRMNSGPNDTADAVQFRMSLRKIATTALSWLQTRRTVNPTGMYC